MNLPNKLTIFRVILIPFFIVTLMLPDVFPHNDHIALTIFIVASITDWFDGYLARKNNLVTNFGKFMDPLADKMLICSALICLVDLGRIPSWMVIIIIIREFFIQGFRTIAADNGVVISASWWGKFKTGFQMFAVGFAIAKFPWEITDILGQVCLWAAVVLTVISMIDYVIKNRNIIKEVK